MRTMVSKIKLRSQDGSSVLSSTILADIGNLTFEQLSSLRHRGAFSTVSLTFAKCCQAAGRSDVVEQRDLLQAWYKVSCKLPNRTSSNLLGCPLLHI